MASIGHQAFQKDSDALGNGLAVRHLSTGWLTSFNTPSNAAHGDHYQQWKSV